MSSRHKIYLAGFDVFREDAIEHGAYLKELCNKHGLEGLFPFDNEVPVGLTKKESASLIARMNMDMIRASTAVLANLNTFRGHEQDSGTAFEVGMAIALGKPVWAYFSPKGTLRDQVLTDENGRDKDGYFVEDFDLPMNLMLSTTWAGSSDTPEQAIASLSRYLRVDQEMQP